MRGCKLGRQIYKKNETMSIEKLDLKNSVHFEQHKKKSEYDFGKADCQNANFGFALVKNARTSYTSICYRYMEITYELV